MKGSIESAETLYTKTLKSELSNLLSYASENSCLLVELLCILRVLLSYDISCPDLIETFSLCSHSPVDAARWLVLAKYKPSLRSESYWEQAFHEFEKVSSRGLCSKSDKVLAASLLHWFAAHYNSTSSREGMPKIMQHSEEWLRQWCDSKRYCDEDNYLFAAALHVLAVVKHSISLETVEAIRNIAESVLAELSDVNMLAKETKDDMCKNPSRISRMQSGISVLLFSCEVMLLQKHKTARDCKCLFVLPAYLSNFSPPSVFKPYLSKILSPSALHTLLEVNTSSTVRKFMPSLSQLKTLYKLYLPLAPNGSQDIGVERDRKVQTASWYLSPFQFLTAADDIALVCQFCLFLKRAGVLPSCFDLVSQEVTLLMIPFVRIPEEVVDPTLSDALYHLFHSLISQLPPGNEKPLYCSYVTESPLYNFLSELIVQFSSCSYGDKTFATIVLLFLRMEYPLECRTLIWKELKPVYSFLRSGEPSFDIHGYLFPSETDFELVLFLCRTLASGHLSSDKNVFLYWLAIHHVHYFYRTSSTHLTVHLDFALKDATTVREDIHCYVERSPYFTVPASR